MSRRVQKEYRPWLMAENTELLIMFSNMCSLQEIGQELKRSKGACQAQLRKLGIYTIAQRDIVQMASAAADDEEDMKDHKVEKADNEGFLELLRKHHPKFCGEIKSTIDGHLFVVKTGGFERLSSRFGLS